MDPIQRILQRALRRQYNQRVKEEVELGHLRFPIGEYTEERVEHLLEQVKQARRWTFSTRHDPA